MDERAVVPLSECGFDPNGEPATAYYRFSAHGQREQSIEGQRSYARAYALAHGYNLVSEYVDRAKTGRNDNRQEFQRMISDAAKHKFRVIILWKVDRFGRNREEIAFNKYRCKKNGVRVEYVEENIPSTPEGVILESVLEGMAEYFSIQLSQNVRRGMNESAKKGQVTGHTPLGYKAGPNKEYVVDPISAPIVQEAYRRYAAGETVTEIVAAFNNQGYLTQQKKSFTRNSLRTILSNKAYLGVYKYGDIVLEGAIPALIDQDTYDKVQRMIKSNKKAPAHKWTKAEYLLSGKLFCGHCGSPMIGESGKGKAGSKYTYYLCAKHKRKEGCPKKAVRQSWIEQLVLEHTLALLHDTELLDYIAHKCWEIWDAQDESKARIARCKARLLEVNAGIRNIIQAIESGMPPQPFSDRLDELSREKDILESAIAEESDLAEIKLTEAQIRFFLYQFRDMNFSDPAAKKRLIDTFVHAVFVYDGKITITFNYTGKDESGSTITLKEVDAATGGECSSAAYLGVPGKVLQFVMDCRTFLLLCPAFGTKM